MKHIRKRLTYANVMSSIAVFLVLAGGAAVAATQLPKNSVGTKQLKKNAVVAAKIKNNAVTTGKIKGQAVASGKIKNGAVVTDKLADGAVSTGKLADSSVATGKIAPEAVDAGRLTQSERSQAFEAEIGSGTIELESPLVEDPTTIVTLDLPTGNFVVHAQTELIKSIGEPAFSECFLSDDGTTISTMSDTYNAGLFFPSGGVSMTGISDGGAVKLACKSTTSATFAFKRKIVATRVGSVG